MPTGQVIINNALTKLNILEQGGTPSSSDSTFALAELNDMWSAWGIDDGLIFAMQQVQYTWLGSVRYYEIGPHAPSQPTYALPNRLYKAVWITSLTSRLQLRLVNADAYFGHTDTGALSVAPEECYYDFGVNPTTNLVIPLGAGDARVYLWPIPTLAGTLELDQGVAFTAWALATSYTLPQGFQDAITWALAFRLMPAFGVAINSQVAQVVAAEAVKAENRIREMNRANRQMLPGTEAVPTPAVAAAGGR